ncbi:MAG: hypothetical protein AAGI37_12615 [Planctomycetota bacterium]
MPVTKAEVVDAKAWLDKQLSGGAISVNATALAHDAGIPEATAAAILLGVSEAEGSIVVHGRTSCWNCGRQLRVDGNDLEAITKSHQAMINDSCPYCNVLLGEEPLDLRFSFSSRGHGDGVVSAALDSGNLIAKFGPGEPIEVDAEFLENKHQVIQFINHGELHLKVTGDHHMENNAGRDNIGGDRNTQIAGRDASVSRDSSPNWVKITLAVLGTLVAVAGLIVAIIQLM